MHLPTSSLAEVERSLAQAIDDKLKNAPFQLVELTIANIEQHFPNDSAPACKWGCP